MTPSELKWLASYEDVLRIRDSLNLTDRQLDIFNLKYIHGLSQQQIADKLCLSYRTIARESSAIKSKLNNLTETISASLCRIAKR